MTDITKIGEDLRIEVASSFPDGSSNWAEEKVMQLVTVAESARDIARTAKCRVGEGATKTHALVDKKKLNKLKRELRKLAPGCLGKE